MKRIIPLLFSIYLILLAIYLGSPILALISAVVAVSAAFPWGSGPSHEEAERTAKEEKEAERIRKITEENARHHR